MVNKSNNSEPTGTNSTKPPWIAGLFAGIFSSADGTWVPMSQLRRFSSVASWMFAFGTTSYGTFRLAERSDIFGHIGIVGLGILYVVLLCLAAATFCIFLRIGGQRFGVEKEKDD